MAVLTLSLFRNETNRGWALTLAAALFGLSSTANAQLYPSFPQPATIPDTSISVEGGVNAAYVPNSLYGNALMSTYVNPSPGSNALGYTISTNGTNAPYSDTQAYSVPSIDCNATTPSTCAAAIRMYQGRIYIAYAESGSNVLDVIVATPVQNSVGYSFAEVFHDPTGVQLTTAPEMEVVNGKLVIVYGSSNNPNVKNAFYSVVYDGTTFLNPSQQYLGSAGIASGAKPALAVLGSTLWMAIQQNNSNHQLFTYSSTDGTTWTFRKQVSSLALGSGASMVSYNGSLVLATCQNNSNRSLFIFSSPDGLNWGYQQYSNILMQYDPGIALLNGGVALAFKSNNSNNYLSDYASH